MIGIGTDFANLSGERSYSLSYYTKGRTSILTYREYVRPAELHSPSAEENCLTENVFDTSFRQGGYTPLRR